MRAELELQTEKHAQQKQDYEDLLVLLEDQDLKIKRFKVSCTVLQFFRNVLTLVFH